MPLESLRPWLRRFYGANLTPAQCGALAHLLPDYVDPMTTPDAVLATVAPVAAAAADLHAEGHGLAALVCDTIFSSDGVHADPPGFLAAAAAAARAAGGLVLADEVQPGFARTGRMWGFERHDLIPDLITMGKPMGNGFPMAGMAARPAHLAAFCEGVGWCCQTNSNSSPFGQRR